MIHALIIEATGSTPSIRFDVASNIFEIKGESRPENTQKFYLPIFEWLDQFIKDSEVSLPSQKIVFKFYLKYFNSTSSKFLMTLITRIEKLKQVGVNVEIQWQYDALDIDMKEMGVEYSNLVNVPFIFVPIQ